MQSNNPNQPKITHPRTEGDISAELQSDLNDPNSSVLDSALDDHFDTSKISTNTDPTIKYSETSMDSVATDKSESAWESLSNGNLPIASFDKKESRSKRSLKAISRIGGKALDNLMTGDKLRWDDKTIKEADSDANSPKPDDHLEEQWLLPEVDHPNEPGPDKK